MKIVASWTRIRQTVLLVIFCGFATFVLAQETEGSFSLALLIASGVLLVAEIVLGIVDHLRSSRPGGVE